MTAREPEIAKKITAYLDHGAAELKAGTVYRLQQARAEVMARLADPQRAIGIEMAHALPGGTPSSGGRRGGWGNLRAWVGLVLLVAAVGYGWQQWRAFQDAKEFGELDAQILSSDLPIDAYLDRGFQNWLKASFER
jgi:hypothetical protein